jgi:DNA-binding CsgD family transcriptional regulator
LGRDAERQAVEMLITRARVGRSGVLVVRGEAGIGKSALLDHVRDAADSSGFRIESSIGVAAEAQFAFAGLHQLCAPLFDRADALPDPQRSALGVAFGRRGGAAPDRFLIGLATLNLFAEVAEEAPLLCLVDDAQWLDEASAQVVAFVARRLAAERIALVLAARDRSDGASSVFMGLPELRLGGLGSTDAHALLSRAVRTPLDERVRGRIVAEARGNPLALLELPLTLQSSDGAGGFELPGVQNVPQRIEENFRSRSAGLPTETRLFLLVAAAEPTGDVALLWRAAAHLGIAPEAGTPAEEIGLLEIDTQVRFRHPLVRSAVYQGATLPDRCRVHGALAAATDPQVDPDRRAWHSAHAVVGTDEEVAAALERSAGRARARGGIAAAAAFLQRSTELTPEPADRTRRALEAAQAKHEAGSSDSALALLAVAEAGPLDALERGRLALLRAQIMFHLTRSSEAPGMLLDAAVTLAPLDAALSCETYLHALDAAIVNGDSRGVVRIAEAALADLPPRVSARPVELLLDGLATSVARGYAAGAPQLRLALEALRRSAREGDRHARESRPWLWLAGRVAVGILEDELAHELAACNVDLARADGAMAGLPGALRLQANVLIISGQLTRAEELAAESAAITDATGGVLLRHAHIILAGWRGDRAAVTEQHDLTRRDARFPEDGAEAALAYYARAVLHNGLGEYAAAQRSAERACESVELSLSSVGLPELIEASVRSGDLQRAVLALEQLSSRARASGTSWALGLEARSRALTMTGPEAEDQYREAIAHLEASLIAGESARAHLIYGEWLRRAGRRQDARQELRTAHELLSDMGAEGFAARAARELSATGEHPRKRTAQPTDALTAQELHIARLVATGATSREVGAQLFLSPRTIEAHLRNIFRKLGITSRRELRELPLP